MNDIIDLVLIAFLLIIDIPAMIIMLIFLFGGGPRR